MYFVGQQGCWLPTRSPSCRLKRVCTRTIGDMYHSTSCTVFLRRSGIVFLESTTKLTRGALGARGFAERILSLCLRGLRAFNKWRSWVERYK